MSAHATIVTLGVSDVARSAAFYEALGFHRSSASEASISFFRAGAIVLAVFGHQALAEDAAVPAGPVESVGFRGVTIAMNLATAEAVDTEYERWVSFGATPVKAPQYAEWGGHSSYVADPDGHLWELAHNPYLPLRADGSGELAD